MMPIGQIHESRRKKNILVLLLICAWVAIIWIIAMVRVGAQ